MPVYFIACGEDGPVKIGWTDSDPGERLRNLQCAHWQKLSLIRVVEGPRSLEGWMHRYFAPHRLRGEWFIKHPEMMTVIVEMTVPPVTRTARCKTYSDVLTLVLRKTGGPTALAAKLGIVPSAITQWINIPARHVPRIEFLTGIKGRTLRPDLYPDEADKRPSPSIQAAA